MIDVGAALFVVGFCGIAAAWDIARRKLAGRAKDELVTHRQALDEFHVELAELKRSLHGEIFPDWKRKVVEMDARIDAVTSTAKSEVAGTIAALGESRSKWR